MYSLSNLAMRLQVRARSFNCGCARQFPRAFLELTRCINSHCKPLFQRLQVLTVPSMYIYNCLVYTRERLEIITKRSDVHCYETRTSLALNIPYHRLSTTQQSVHYRGIKLFNCLNEPWKFEKLSKFKKHLKDYLVDKAYYSIQQYFDQ